MAHIVSDSSLILNDLLELRDIKIAEYIAQGLDKIAIGVPMII